MATQKNEARETVKLEGVVKSTYNKVEKDENGNVTSVTNTILLNRDGLTVGGSTDVKGYFDKMYAGVSNKKFIPSWHKEEKPFISVKSSYNIPCKIDSTGEQMSFAEFVERGNISGAKVVVKCNVKPNALYPSAMLILEEGEPYDAFKDF